MVAKSLDFLLNQIRNAVGTLGGGTVTFYAAGTTTPLAIYLDRDMQSAAANPYTLTSDGTAELYGRGLYRVIFKDSTGVTVYDYDYISVYPSNYEVSAQPSIELNVLDYGALADGTTDDSAAFAALWVDVRAAVETLDPNGKVAPISVKIPSGTYYIGTSVNWTNAFAWNIHVDARGAVLLGNCPDKPVVDLTAVRGVHLDGMEIHGDAANTPSCGILVGQSSTVTCGNNRFSSFKTTGYFTIAGFCNIGSETTYYDFCYFQNSEASTSAFAYAGDGRHVLGATSDYTTLRSPGTAVSFTNNFFTCCRFANYVTSIEDSDAVYLDGTTGWGFDRGCYFLTFGGACIRVVNNATYRNVNLDIAGLFETNQSLGMKYCVRFVCADGSFSGIDGFRFVCGAPQIKTSVLHIEASLGTPMTTGYLKLNSAFVTVGDLELQGDAGAKVFSGDNFFFKGTLAATKGSQCNLGDLTKFAGILLTDDTDTVDFGGVGTNGPCINVDEDYVSFGGREEGRVVVMNADSSNPPGLTVDGPATDIGLRIITKGAGQLLFDAPFVNPKTLGSSNLGTPTLKWGGICAVSLTLGTNASTNVDVEVGSGSPEGVVNGSKGDVYLRTDGGVGTTLYVKESGTSSTTGWTAFGSFAPIVGTATITGGTTYIDVTHGYGSSPSTARIQVVPTNQYGVGFWISNVGATTFRINLAADPVTSATYAWAIV